MFPIKAFSSGSLKPSTNSSCCQHKYFCAILQTKNCLLMRLSWPQKKTELPKANVIKSGKFVIKYHTTTRYQRKEKMKEKLILKWISYAVLSTNGPGLWARTWTSAWVSCKLCETISELNAWQAFPSNPIYIYHPQPYYDIGQQKTCKSGKNGQCPYCSNNKTARDKRKTNKTKVSPLPSTICCLPFYVKSPHGNNKNKDAPPHRASYNICDPCLDQ